MPPSFPLLFFWPQLGLRSRACKTQGPPPDFHRAFPAQQKQPWLTAAEDTAGVSGEKKHFQQKALDLLFMFKATECGLCPHLPRNCFCEGHRDPLPLLIFPWTSHRFLGLHMSQVKPSSRPRSASCVRCLREWSHQKPGCVPVLPPSCPLLSLSSNSQRAHLLDSLDLFPLSIPSAASNSPDSPDIMLSLLIVLCTC